jgi:hypothetical protein
VCRTDDDTDVVRSTARRLVSLAMDGDLYVWLLSGPVFYRARLARTVILIKEAWDGDTGSGEEGPC